MTTALTLVQPPDTAPLQLDGLGLIARAKALAIIDNDSFQSAAVEVRYAATLRKNIEKAFEPSVSAANLAHKELTALRAKALEPPTQAEAILKRKIADYTIEQQRAARAEQARLEAEAKQRQDAAALAEAEQVQAAGDTRGAEQIIEEAAATPAPIIAIDTPRAAGISGRTRWTYRFTDFKAITREFLTPDEKKIGQMVRALGPDAAKIIGGIEVVEDFDVSVRANSGR